MVAVNFRLRANLRRYPLPGTRRRELRDPKRGGVLGAEMDTDQPWRPRRSLRCWICC
jgi:hypothetical protein